MMHHRNLSLDGLRGIAILLVLVYHATPTMGTNSRLGEAVLWAAHLGWVGVEVFFVLSGYLITGILLKTRDQPRYFTNFYLRRALRIWPLYCGVLLLLLLVPLFLPALQTADYDRFLSMQGWLWLHSANMAGAYYGANAALQFGWLDLNHFWSLSVEEHFYLVWPLVVYLARRHLAAIAIGVAVVSVLLQVMPIADPFWRAVAATPTHLFGLAVGGLTAMGRKPPRLLVAAMLVVTLAWIAVGGINPYSKALLACACALSTAALIVYAQGARVLRNPVLVSFGVYSYGIYVFHYLFEPVAWTIDFAKWPGGYVIGAASFVALYIAAAYGAARISHATWELPWIKMKDRLTSVG